MALATTARIDGGTPKRIDAQQLDETLVKAGRTQLYAYLVENPNTSKVYLHLYDVAAAAGVTPGTTVPKWSHPVPKSAGSGDDGSAGGILQVAMPFTAGLVVACSTNLDGTGDPASGCVVQLLYV